MIQARSRFYNSTGKRMFDAVFSLCVLILSLPAIILVAAAIRLTSSGPAIFRQQRIGKDGKPFTIYKFRTMYVDAAPYATTPRSDDRDPRVTWIGRYLRRSGSDELPQFVNVLRGEMSVVGPRPEMPILVEQYTPRQRRRLRVLPGVTGLWQINEARRDPIHENLHFDMYYIRNRSAWLDLTLIARTCFVMVRRRPIASSQTAVPSPVRDAQSSAEPA